MEPPLDCPWDEGRTLDGSWSGILEVAWQEGKPLHLASITSSSRYGFTTRFILAVKSHGALQSFLISLRQYVKERRDTHRNVLVINGRDFPRSSGLTWDRSAHSL